MRTFPGVSGYPAMLTHSTVAGAAVRILCDAPWALGGAWHIRDVIVFVAGKAAGQLSVVGASGGTPVPVTPIPGPRSSQRHVWPVFLPGSTS